VGRGSKQTVYAHFHDKETLFREMVTTQVGRADDPVSPVAARLPEADTLEDDLRELAREHLALVIRPELVRLRRTLIGEAERFPDLASEWYRRGPEQSATLFASWFERPGERGLLNLPDTQLAAQTHLPRGIRRLTTESRASRRRSPPGHAINGSIPDPVPGLLTRT